jgi:hypothetical protein
MGCSFSAISDDIDEYVFLCKQYGEKVQYSSSSPDCYGKHAAFLKKAARETLITFEEHRKAYLDSLDFDKQEKIRLQKLREDTLKQLTPDQIKALRIRIWEQYEG